MNFADRASSVSWCGVVAFCAFVALAAPAAAQTQGASGAPMDGSAANTMTGISLGGSGPDETTVEKRREIEKAYRDATQKIPVQATAKNDPWANMRGPEEQKPAAHPAPRTAQKKKPAQ
jgi:hypothetical protein